MPVVSVLLPVRNAATTLAAALDSLLAQTFTDFELLIIDDGSADATPQLLAQFAARDARIRVFTTAPRGIVAALNLGLSEAKGEYIARMDADDVSHPQRLEKQVAFLHQHPQIGLCSCRVNYGGNATLQAGYARYVDWINSLITPEQLALNRFVESPFAHPSIVFRKKLVAQYGAYREGNFPEDYELILRWLEQGVEMAKLDEALLTWNDPPQRLSRTDVRYAPQQFYAVKARYLAHWLHTHNPFYPDVIVWGAGRVTRKRVALLAAEGIRINAYLDFDPKKINAPVAGPPRKHFTELPEPGNSFVLVFISNPGARDECRTFLQGRGYVEGKDFLCCA